MADETDISEIVSELKMIAPAGFAMAFHVRFTTPTFLLQSYPAEWIAHYSQNGLVMQDPTVHWGFENTGAIDWADLLERDTAGVMAQAAEHGLRHGMTYAANRSDSLTVTSFARSDRPFDDAERQRIQDGVDRIHDATLNWESLDPKFSESLKRMSITATPG